VIGGQLASSHTRFFPKCIGYKFEIAILSKIVKRSLFVETINALNACFFKSLNDSSEESKNKYIRQRNLVNMFIVSEEKKYYIENFSEQKEMSGALGRPLKV